jgi:CRISPR system Cascade subunit CasD
MKTILLKLAGPLQSWGTTSHFETRQTDRYPSKSAVIGLIAACLGYRRDNDEEISKLNNLDFAVRIDQAGQLLRDYHTAKKYKKNGTLDRTYVTNRYYLEDAVFVVAIGSEDIQMMSDIEDGLKEPYFQPFMGRRSLPLSADFLIGSKEDGVIESLNSLPWQASEWFQKKQSNKVPIYADADLLSEEAVHMRQDRVKSFSQKNRQFGFRSEGRKIVEVRRQSKQISALKEEHDAFNGIGG